MLPLAGFYPFGVNFMDFKGNLGSTDVHQTVAAVEFETESVVTITQEHVGCPLPCFLATHAIGIADAMVAGHEVVGDGVRVCWYDGRNHRLPRFTTFRSQ